MSLYLLFVIFYSTWNLEWGKFGSPFSRSYVGILSWNLVWQLISTPKVLHLNFSLIQGKNVLTTFLLKNPNIHLDLNFGLGDDNFVFIIKSYISVSSWYTSKIFWRCSVFLLYFLWKPSFPKFYPWCEETSSSVSILKLIKLK